MRTFITVAPLVAMVAAHNEAVTSLVKQLRSFAGGKSACSSDKKPGFFAKLKREASEKAAYYLADGYFCREMIALIGNAYYMIPSGDPIKCVDTRCQAAWRKLMVVNGSADSVRCLVPQRALPKEAPVHRDLKWRQIHGSQQFVRLELPDSGMPCVRYKCGGQAQCKDTSANIPMCTTTGEVIEDTVAKILENVNRHTASEISGRHTCIQVSHNYAPPEASLEGWNSSEGDSTYDSSSNGVAVPPNSNSQGRVPPLTPNSPPEASLEGWNSSEWDSWDSTNDSSSNGVAVPPNSNSQGRVPPLTAPKPNRGTTLSNPTRTPPAELAEHRPPSQRVALTTRFRTLPTAELTQLVSLMAA